MGNGTNKPTDCGAMGGEEEAEMLATEVHVVVTPLIVDGTDAVCQIAPRGEADEQFVEHGIIRVPRGERFELSAWRQRRTSGGEFRVVAGADGDSDFDRLRQAAVAALPQHHQSQRQAEKRAHVLKGSDSLQMATPSALQPATSATPVSSSVQYGSENA